MDQQEIFRLPDSAAPVGAAPPWPFAAMAPREVQERALAAGWGKFGFAYFLRQRLGKSPLAYAEYTLLRQQGHVDWMVIICPNSIKQQWYEQIEDLDFTTPRYVYKSSNKKDFERWAKVVKEAGGVLIINYESVKSFMNSCYYRYIDTLRTYIVADESTKIKTPSLKLSKACLELSSVCMYKRILSGKPTANSNLDLWSQLAFIGATNRNFHQHKYTFSKTAGYKGMSLININTEQLKNEMAPYSYVADQKYIEGFDKSYEPMRYVKLTGKLKEMYDKMEDELIIELSESVSATAPIVLTKYLRLQQISSGIIGDIDGEQHNLVDPHENPKIKVLVDILENEVTNKVIIACRFTKSIENLYKVLTSKGYKVAQMYGKIKNIDEQKALFHEGDHDILIGQTQMLAYGHTLCGKYDNNPCLDVIFFENDFSLLNRSQIESRPEKLERRVTISMWDMYASKMEEYILKTLIKKEDAAIALLGYSRNKGVLAKGIHHVEDDENGTDDESEWESEEAVSD